jgi:hypothetical protein
MVRDVGVAGSNSATPTIDLIQVFLLAAYVEAYLVTSILMAWSQIWSQLGAGKFVFYLRRD